MRRYWVDAVLVAVDELREELAEIDSSDLNSIHVVDEDHQTVLLWLLGADKRS